MAGLRHGRPHCIRAAFSATTRAGSSRSSRAAFHKRPWSKLRRVKASHIKNFVEGFWREFLDDSDEEADNVSGPLPRSPGPLRGASGIEPSPKARGAEVTPEELIGSRLSDLVPRGDMADVDMQPVEAWPGGSMDVVMAAECMELDLGRHVQGRARVSPRVSPQAPRPLRLGGEKDKTFRLARSKRKLELLLGEPERRKGKKPRAT